MGLITETNAQYYAGQQTITAASGQTIFNWTGDVSLVLAIAGVSNANFKVLKNNAELIPITDYDMSANVITLTAGATLNDTVLIQLLNTAIADNYGSYEYISLKDVVNNFMVAYVGMDKLIPRVKRSDVIFHAKRGLQEFSYDTLKSVNSQELTIPPSLGVAIPQDYVNYVRCSWIDNGGVQHIIYPVNNLTTDPTQLPVQDSAGVPTQDGIGSNLQAAQSKTEQRWQTRNVNTLNGRLDASTSNVYDNYWGDRSYGQRYGLEPQVSQQNGWFSINQRLGTFSFSSNLANRLIVLEYISDGLAYDMDSKIPKMAEDAMYAHLSYSILSSRANTQEYIVQRYRKERSAKLRNAKIRLSNIKLDEIAQVMRGKSKWIKH